MKSKLMIIGVIVLLMLTNSMAVFADTETTVTMQADKTEVKAGETFTVTLKGTCPDGINGIATTYSYDTEKLELESATVVNTNYSDSSNKAENEIFVYNNSTEKITTADLYKLTFKVKEGIDAGSTAKVSIEETLLDSDAATDSEHTIAAQEVTVTVIAATTGDDDEENPSTGDEDDSEAPSTGDEDNSETPSTGDEDNSETPSTGDGNNSETPSTDDENKTEQPTTEGTTVVVGGEKDNTTASTSIPKAGISSIILVAIIAVAGVAIIIYKKNKSYSDIK